MEEKLRKEIWDANISFLDQNIETMRDVAEKWMSSRQTVVQHIYQLVTAIGIVAGFGFTALSSVHTFPLYFLGEFLLLSAMAAGMKFVQPGYIKTEKDFQSWMSGIQEAIDLRLTMRDDDPLDDMKKVIMEARDKELRIFKTTDNNSVPKINRPEVLFWLFCAGSFVLLLSFTNFLG